MSMKKFDLAKQLGLKVAGNMKTAGVPNRFAQGSAEVLDKRERRLRDAAAGLVPFACKLPSGLIKRLHERALPHEGGLNGLMAELLNRALSDEAVAPAAPASKKKVEKAAKAAPEPAAPAKKAAAKKAPAKKTAQP